SLGENQTALGESSTASRGDSGYRGIDRLGQDRVASSDFWIGSNQIGRDTAGNVSGRRFPKYTVESAGGDGQRRSQIRGTRARFNYRRQPHALKTFFGGSAFG